MEKLAKLLTQLKDADVLRQMGDDDEMGSLFVNPIVLTPKSDYARLVIDARFSYTLVTYTLVPDADQVAKNLKVSHFDCGAMTENTLYALNQVRQCHITPEELEISQTKIILYTKHFRKERELALRT